MVFVDRVSIQQAAKSECRGAEHDRPFQSAAGVSEAWVGEAPRSPRLGLR